MTRSFIYDNMACQQGKGTDLARSRIKELLHRAYLKNGSEFYILQCDVKGYYKNMKHEAVNTSFERRLPPGIYERTEAVLETQYEGDTGYNPGSQMVQIAGISFLDKFDHFVKETLRMKEYMRYIPHCVDAEGGYYLAAYLFNPSLDTFSWCTEFCL